jgi:hypothetical protein
VREAGGNLVVEVRKAEGHPIELGLEAGPYVVAMDGGTVSFEASVTLALGQRTELGRLAFHPGRPLEVATARGDGSPPAAAPAPVAAAAPSLGVAAPAPVPAPLRPTAVHLGLFPLGGEDRLDVHGLAFGFVAERVGRLSSGLELSLAGNVVDHDIYGTQITVGANIARGSGRAAQLAVGLNYVGGSLDGLQAVSGANVVQGDFRGAQLSAGANYAAGKVDGAQLAAGINASGGAARGVQLAGGLNLATAFRGVQAAGGASLAGTMTGLQLSPVNLAGDVNGLQLGVVSYAHQMSGAQVGVVNVSARSRGFKLGVVNIAREHDGEAIGIINLIGDGIHSVAAYATDTMLSNVAVKLGSRHVYTSLIFGYNPGDRLSGTTLQSNNQRVGFGLGLGYRKALAMGRLKMLEIEASSMSVRSGFSSQGSSNDVSVGFDGNSPLLASARVVVGVQLWGRLMAIAGISDNVAVAWGGRDLNIGSGFLESVKKDGTTIVRQYPGLLLGFQI